MLLDSGQWRFLGAIYGVVLVTLIIVVIAVWLASIELGPIVALFLEIAMMLLVSGLGAFMLSCAFALAVKGGPGAMAALVAGIASQGRRVARGYAALFAVVGTYFLALPFATFVLDFPLRSLASLVGAGHGMLWLGERMVKPLGSSKVA